ncbi:MAG: SAF domain-containing protein [Candidatus Dormibacteria bacterium]
MDLGERFGGRRGLQVAVLSLALLVVLAFLAVDTIGRPQATRAVWVLTRSVSAGTPLDHSMVREERVPDPRENYPLLVVAPTGKLAAHALSPGDILRPDDVESSPHVAVPVKLGGYQPGAGDLVDIYAIDAGKATLVGRGITVVASSTIEVPASDEALWVALYGTSATLLSAKSNGTGVPDAGGVSGPDAVRRLAVLAQGGSGAPAAP